MNILFHTSYQVSIHKGGTERVTTRTCEALTKLGHHCFNSYIHPISSKYNLAEFEDTLCITNVRDLKDFILHHRIEIVVLQGITETIKYFVEFKINHPEFKILSAYHFSPGAERYMISAYNKKKLLNNTDVSTKRKIEISLQLMLYPIYSRWKIGRYKALYKYVYEHSDKTILLSKSFIDEFKAFGSINDSNKFEIIPNSLSYDDYISSDMIKCKRKQVLVVSRLEEVQKRISLVIRIWKSIESDRNLREWELHILGIGESLNDYKKLVEDFNLKRVYFEGLREPKEYYIKSSIFLMTSKYEGWGLTLTEAQQFGCVPIAFDTYTSLGDIILSGTNGIIVPEGEVDCFISELKKIMSDSYTRYTMGLNAVASSKKYSIDNVGLMWNDLLSRIIN